MIFAFSVKRWIDIDWLSIFRYISRFQVVLIYHWSFHQYIHLIIWKLFKQNHREFVRYSRTLITVCPQYSGYVNNMLLFAAPKQQIFMFSWWRTDRTATTSNQLTLFHRGKSKLYVTLVQGKTNLISWETFTCWASIKKFYYHNGCWSV